MAFFDDLCKDYLLFLILNRPYIFGSSTLYVWFQKRAAHAANNFHVLSNMDKDLYERSVTSEQSVHLLTPLPSVADDLYTFFNTYCDHLKLHWACKFGLKFDYSNNWELPYQWLIEEQSL